MIFLGKARGQELYFNTRDNKIAIVYNLHNCAFKKLFLMERWWSPWDGTSTNCTVF